jgi:hypothetical protein
VRLVQLNDALAISPPPSHAGSPYETIASKETLKRMTTSIFRHMTIGTRRQSSLSRDAVLDQEACKNFPLKTDGRQLPACSSCKPTLYWVSLELCLIAVVIPDTGG